MDPSPSCSGMLYIYNIYFFKKCSNRTNSEKDVVALKKTFKTMNWDVCDLSEDTLSDIRKQERTPKLGKSELERITKKMKKISKIQFPTNCQYVAFAVLTHGASDGIIHLYKEQCDLKETFLEPLFRNDSLQNKLKWLIYPGCRGACTYESFSGNHNFLNYRYYLVSYGTNEGYTTRRGKNGNVFIQDLCSVLRKQKFKHDKDDILTILNEVKQNMEIRKHKQIPENETNLASRKVYLYNN
ncbi:uncharacterized protein LOC129939567 [Eupeodes corollae]|uniref:uncharacterized protein LOC129939567 n=1 Tax=Eupeodes corollae TaxID=290404 RepID=UPI0024918CAD|nr:uncharacterized protein LOC129939567 [Eupeodes corollae]